MAIAKTKTPVIPRANNPATAKIPNTANFPSGKAKAPAKVPAIAKAMITAKIKAEFNPSRIITIKAPVTIIKIIQITNG
jgi:hypothetical protein